MKKELLSRRAFVRDALALGVSLSTIGSLLAACGRTDAPEPSPEGGEEGLGDRLHVYNWSDYIAEETIPAFEKETGIEVVYDTYESNEEMLAKLQSGASGYDVVVPSGYVVTVLRALDLLAPLDRSKLTNLGNLSPIFAGAPHDPENAFSLPYQWGITGIAYRKDKLATPPDSWAIFHDAAYKGRMTQADDPRDVIGAWLKFRGHSINSKDPAQLEQAKVDAIAAKANLIAYLSAPVKSQLVAGDVWIAQLWNGDTVQASREEANVAFAIPKEGGVLWTDTVAIPKDAPHKAAAHAFLDYLLRPDVAAAIADYTGYGSPNAAALERMEAPVPFPTEDERKRLEVLQDLGEATELWDRIWTEIKAA